MTLSPRYDLHSHTTASDGSLTPTALVEYAAACATTVLAVTDHDTTAGVAEAIAAGSQNDVTVVPGIEISVTWSGQTIHVVGLHVDPQHHGLLEGLKSIQEFRQWRAQEIGRRLHKSGIEGGYEGALRFSNGQLISRTHFARYLVEQGYAKDLRQVFTRYLTHNKPGYVPGKWAALEDAVKWIDAAGGIAVIAHPARYKYSATRLRHLLGEFRELGGIGLEVVSGSHSYNDIVQCAELARQLRLFASRGSDYHGPIQAYADPRRLPDLPEHSTPIWESEQWHVCSERLTKEYSAPIHALAHTDLN